MPEELEKSESIYYTTAKKHLEVHKDLLFTFVDLEKAYDRVPRDLVYWCLRRRGVPGKLERLVEATYHGASTVARTMHGRTVSHQSWPTSGIRAKPIPVYHSTRCHQRRVQMWAAM